MQKDRDNSLLLMIERLKAIQADGDQIAAIRSIRKKCDEAFLPFAESEISFIDKNNLDEAGAHILALHADAFTLRRDCDSLLRSSAPEDSQLSSSVSGIKETFIECCARIENICSLRRPDLLVPLDAVL